MAASPTTVIASRQRYSGQPGTSWGKWKPTRGRKLKLAEIPGALAAHDRAQHESDRIRAAIGLAPVPENPSVRAWRERMANGPSAQRTRAAIDRASTAVDVQPLDEVAKALAARKRAESRIVKAVRTAKEAGVSVAEVASQLGMTRQGVYAMLARA